jgi:L-amino acid N-acyltransferase YncA
MIADVNVQHAARICEIYNHYVRDTNITFETEEITVAEMQARITKAHERHAFIGWFEKGTLLGYASCAWKAGFARQGPPFQAEETGRRRVNWPSQQPESSSSSGQSL